MRGDVAVLGRKCSLATNSLMLRFDFRDRAKGRAYLWVEPPWPLTHAGRLVTGSTDWPVWDGVEQPEVNRPLWEAWCGLFAPLDRSTLAEAVVGKPLPDLRLRFASGHEVEVFSNSAEGYWWYYRNRVTGEVFEAGASGIVREQAEPAEG